MPSYFLPPHVHFCFRGSYAVCLDLKNDSYVLIDGNAAAVLRHLSALSEPPLEADLCESALHELLTNGLLVRDGGLGRPISESPVELASSSLLGHEISYGRRISMLHVFRFVLACIRAKSDLRWRHIEKIVTSIQKSKARHRRSEAFDMHFARELTAIFLRLRSFFPARYLCLYDSLALLHFLAGYRVFPTWVFGVRLEPWEAHCWVQEDDIVFNDGAEEVSDFAPILAI